ncbi:MAG TPA: hypothetical protein VEU27_16450 [Gemmatimonadales bacterium]|nr:hypothetical protein [Gemmatimonadales bacterium]
MMDVYHEEFRDSIAVDGRISAISAVLGLRFTSYAEEEAFYIEVAKEAGLNGWELDRLPEHPGAGQVAAGFTTGNQPNLNCRIMPAAPEPTHRAQSCGRGGA